MSRRPIRRAAGAELERLVSGEDVVVEALLLDSDGDPVTGASPVCVIRRGISDYLASGSPPTIEAARQENAMAEVDAAEHPGEYRFSVSTAGMAGDPAGAWLVTVSGESGAANLPQVGAFRMGGWPSTLSAQVADVDSDVASVSAQVADVDTDVAAVSTFLTSHNSAVGSSLILLGDNIATLSGQVETVRSRVERLYGLNQRTRLYFASPAVTSGQGGAARNVPDGHASHMEVSIRSEGDDDFSPEAASYFVVFHYESTTSGIVPAQALPRASAPEDGTFSSTGWLAAS